MPKAKTVFRDVISPTPKKRAARKRKAKQAIQKASRKANR